MKTVPTSTGFFTKSLKVKTISLAFFACSLLLSNTGFSTTIIPGIRAAEFITGNQLGSNLSASFCLTSGKSNLSMGPIIQLRQFHLSGLQTSYRFDFGNEDGRASVFVFSSLIYQQAAYLSKSCVRTENFVAKGEAPVKFEDVKLSTVEMYGGFGVNVRHNDFISSSWSIGFGLYNTLHGSIQSMEETREKSAAVLMLKCSLNINFKKEKCGL